MVELKTNRAKSRNFVSFVKNYLLVLTSFYGRLSGKFCWNKNFQFLVTLPPGSTTTGHRGLCIFNVYRHQFGADNKFFWLARLFTTWEMNEFCLISNFYGLKFWNRLKKTINIFSVSLNIVWAYYFSPRLRILEPILA